MNEYLDKCPQGLIPNGHVISSLKWACSEINNWNKISLPDRRLPFLYAYQVFHSSH